MWESRVFQFFIVWYICGVILLSLDALPPWLEWANVVFLMLAGSLGVIYFCQSYGTRKGLLASLVIFTVSMYTEYLGTTHGLIFGKYVYTTDFGLLLFGVPFTIGFAWLLVMSTSHALLQVIRPPGLLLHAVYGGIIAVVMDLVLDPVSFKVKNYWVWQDSGAYYGIPAQNFVGWFLVAAVLHLFLYRYLQNGRTEDHPVWHKRMILLYLLILAMFMLLASLAHMYLAVAMTGMGLLIIISHYLWRRRVTS
ncbi:carotenoid biosynthesis protein [Ectobacillus ponti]|uniref:Carotenoid biosynthesis protein n=1 Tax=Ectobacillus ponti TaxID=2961894 RepID=A0AA42BP05_9BACI|nr:carotenoid biosynthesis protein [Ectobacillus ponti]MCP8968262.1 carotenoid biosynthesis protein [Ectobacillus ponti]